MPQGTVFGPTLFLLFINDQPFYVKSSIRLFADDRVIHNEIKSGLDVFSLQSDLDDLHRWKQEWLMDFTPEVFRP